MRLGFLYELTCSGADGRVLWRRKYNNIIPDEGRDYILYAAFEGGIQHYPWYLGLYAANYGPTAGETLSSLVSNGDEITTYDTGSRIRLSTGVSADGVWGTGTREARTVFIDNTDIRGLFITSAQAWGSTNGVLLSVVRLPSPEVVAIGQEISFSVGFVFFT